MNLKLFALRDKSRDCNKKNIFKTFWILLKSNIKIHCAVFLKLRGQFCGTALWMIVTFDNYFTIIQWEYFVL